LKAIAMKTIELNRQPVELFKILKFEGLVDSGGAAKMAISEGVVRVNGKVETQKRKQIVSGDVIEFQGIELLVNCAAAD
jgi:ribosome-associated protein